MSEDRLSALEARFAWLERHVVEQDRTMLEFADELRRLKEQLKRVRDRAGAPQEESDERPPHY
ncbi:MAG TPA: SlyX family protein [Opitutaceae bacterium]|jgi:SlyX protein